MVAQAQQIRNQHLNQQLIRNAAKVHQLKKTNKESSNHKQNQIRNQPLFTKLKTICQGQSE
jgi:protein subunit release factor B